MKFLLSSVLGLGVLAAFTAGAFAQCGHEQQSAKLLDLTVASEKTKPQEAMSTHDQVVIKDLIGEVKPTDSAAKITD